MDQEQVSEIDGSTEVAEAVTAADVRGLVASVQAAMLSCLERMSASKDPADPKFISDMQLLADLAAGTRAIEAARDVRAGPQPARSGPGSGARPGTHSPRTSPPP